MTTDPAAGDAQVGEGELDPDALDAELPPVEVWAREATADELCSVSVSAAGRTSRRIRPAAQIAEKARAAGWKVHGPLYARGPFTRGVRQEEPNADGKRPTIPVTTVEDSLAVRLVDPAGTHLVAWWAAGKSDAGRWVVCTHPAGHCPRVEVGKGTKTDPRREAVDCNYRNISIEDLKAIVEAGPRTEEAAPMPEPEKEIGPVGKLAERARESFEAWHTARRPEFPETEKEACELVAEAWIGGYVAGTDRANEEAGNVAEEGYAQGLAAIAGHATVFVATRRRLDALKKGDVVLGKGKRWWIVEGSQALPARQWHAWAYSGEERLDVRSDAKRHVDVVEEIAIADALAALKADGLAPTPVASAVA